MNKRNPRLVPYNLLDEKTKKTNRDSVCAAVRTLIGYGYNIEPPDQESSESVHLVIYHISLFKGNLISFNEFCTCKLLLIEASVTIYFRWPWGWQWSE